MPVDAPLEIDVPDHPLLALAAFVTRFPAPLAEMGVAPEIARLSDPGAPAPLLRSEPARAAIRDLLRHGGYRPAGRGKPASEYLVRAAEEGALRSIDVAVDACNAVSLHSGLPISVVDLDLARPPFRIGIAPEGAAYVFNASGQEIDLTRLLCLFDAEGPCANAVRDSQRTKTRPETRRTLSVVWGTTVDPARLGAAERWYRSLLEGAGAATETVATRVAAR